MRLTAKMVWEAMVPWCFYSFGAPGRRFCNEGEPDCDTYTGKERCEFKFCPLMRAAREGKR